MECLATMPSSNSIKFFFIVIKSYPDTCPKPGSVNDDTTLTIAMMYSKQHMRPAALFLHVCEATEFVPIKMEALRCKLVGEHQLSRKKKRTLIPLALLCFSRLVGVCVFCVL